MNDWNKIIYMVLWHDRSVWRCFVTGARVQHREGRKQSGSAGQTFIQDKYEAGHFAAHIGFTDTACTKQRRYPSRFEIHVPDHTKDCAMWMWRNGKPMQTQQHASSRIQRWQKLHTHRCIDGGDFVAGPLTVPGPAASASAGVSAITRMHAAFYDPSTDPQTWAKRRTAINYWTSACPPHFPVQNGKLIFSQTEPRTLAKRIPSTHSNRTAPTCACILRHRSTYMEKMKHPPVIDQVRTLPQPTCTTPHSRTSWRKNQYFWMRTQEPIWQRNIATLNTLCSHSSVEVLLAILLHSLHVPSHKTSKSWSINEPCVCDTSSFPSMVLFKVVFALCSQKSLQGMSDALSVVYVL